MPARTPGPLPPGAPAPGAGAPLGADASPRQRILQAAHDLFYAEGIRATGIDRVIAEAQVTKVTFYRQFPSKDALVLAFLELRHARWMDWFVDALGRHGGHAGAVVPALREWLANPQYRGCAFINAVGELGPVQAEVVEAARCHKQAMTDAVAALLPPGRGRAADARAIAVAIDGAIVQVQLAPDAEAALQALARLVQAVAPEGTAAAARLRPARRARASA